MERFFLTRYFKKRIEELLGESRKAYEGGVLELAPMMRQLVQFTDRDWCVYAFSRERLKDLLTPEERQTMGLGAMECGREYAHRLQETWGSDVNAAAEGCGLDVSYVHNPERFRRGEAARFAAFEAPNKVTIYADCVERAETVCREEGLYEILGDVSFHDILLAHELFHYLEEQDKDTVYTLQTKVKVTKNPIIHKYSTVFVLSEIAGMAFASELLGIPYCMYAMDCLFSYLYSPQAASDLFRMTMRITKKADGSALEPAKSE